MSFLHNNVVDVLRDVLDAGACPISRHILADGFILRWRVGELRHIFSPCSNRHVPGFVLFRDLLVLDLGLGHWGSTRRSFQRSLPASP